MAVDAPVKHQWEEHDIPPFSFYIPEDMQWEVLKARTKIAVDGHLCTLFAEHIADFIRARFTY